MTSKTSKKSRHKKSLEQVYESNNSVETMGTHVESGSEEAIKRQFTLIQKDYQKLMQDISKEYGLVREWIGEQVAEKRELIREKLN